MATVIQIKRSANITAPTTSDLEEGELAYSYDKSSDGAGAKLYIEALDSGNSPVIHAIGGKFYTDAVDGATNNNTAGKIVKRDASGNFSANVITANEFVGNITGTISGEATSAGIATLANSAVIANTANTLTTGRVINLGGDLEGNVTFNGSSDVTIVANVRPNSVVLGTDTTGDYLSNVLAGTGISITGQIGETATPTINLTNTGVSAGHYGGATQVPAFEVDAQGRIVTATNVSVSTAITLAADSGAGDTLNNGDTLRVSGGTGIDTTVTDNTISVALETSGVAASTYGGSSQIPVFTVDATGRLTSAANVAVAGVSSFTASGNSFTITTSDSQTFTANIQPNSVRLGTDTTGDYVKNVLPGVGIEITGVPGEDRESFILLANTAVTTGTYGGASNIPYFTVDQQGRLTAAGNVAVSTSISLSDGTSTDTLNNGDTLRVLGGTGITSSLTDNTFTITNSGVTSLASGGFGLSVSAATGSVSVTNTGVTRVIAGTGVGIDNETGNATITNTGVVSVSGTANEITVSASNGTVQIGMPDNITVGGDLSVTGNLYVTGNVVSYGVENLIVEDSLIQLANNNITTDIIDIGFYGSYNSDGGEHEHAGLFRDASDGLFRLFKGLQGQDNLTSTVNISGNGYSIATLVANLTGGTVSGLTANIAVSDGGTGRGTLTTNAVLYGQGTSAVGLATGTAGQVLQLNVSGVPVFADIDGGSY